VVIYRNTQHTIGLNSEWSGRIAVVVGRTGYNAEDVPNRYAICRNDAFRFRIAPHFSKVFCRRFLQPERPPEDNPIEKQVPECMPHFVGDIVGGPVLRDDKSSIQSLQDVGGVVGVDRDFGRNYSGRGL